MSSSSDHFELLGLRRTAALGEEEIVEAFHAVSRESHPDARGPDVAGDGDGGMDFAEVSEAFRMLKDPASRLQHLLDLEFGKPGEGDSSRAMISGDLLDLFAAVGEALAAADGVLKKKAESQTALGRAVLAPEEMMRQGRLQELAVQLDEELAAARARLPALDAILVSEKSRAEPAGRELARRFRYLARWQQQVREKLMEFLLSD